MIGELLTPSALSTIMNEFEENCPNLDPGVNQLLEPLQVFEPAPLLQHYENDAVDCKPPISRKRSKKMCDSTIENSATANNDDLPCLEPFPGHLNFQLYLPNDCAPHRWTFSQILHKVFIDIDKVLALQFKWNFRELKPDVQLFVRALPVYTGPDHLKIPVLRCPVHVLPDNPLNNSFPHVEHVIRCEHTSTRYERNDNTRRLSCVTPLSYPQPGSDSTTLTYKFVCKTSCTSGMDRKPISIIFTLEDMHGYIYGRQQLAVKICSCPKRDKQKEEKNEQERQRGSKPVSPAVAAAAAAMTAAVAAAVAAGGSVVDAGTAAAGANTSVPNLACVNSTCEPCTSNADCLRDIQYYDSESDLSSRNTSRGAAIAAAAAAAGALTPTPDRRLSGKVKRQREDELLDWINNARSELELSNVRVLDSMQNLNQNVTQMMSKLEEDRFNEFELFGKFIAGQLKNFPMQQAHELQYEIQRLIMLKRTEGLQPASV